MTKHFITFAFALLLVGITSTSDAQSKKEKKSRYYQNSEPEQAFNVQGFYMNDDKKEVDGKPIEDEYDVKVSRSEDDKKYRGEKRVRDKNRNEEEIYVEKPKRAKKEKASEGYYTTYGGKRTYNENRDKYDKYYAPQSSAPKAYTPPPAQPPTPPKPARVKKQKAAKEREIKMTENEHEYKTTVVKRRYTNLDVLCDDLDLAKIQRPVFKGICSECANEVDLIISNKNLSSLEKNYQLKNSYMMRDKRLRETLDEDQYKKFLRIKDTDEYLVLTKDSELKDGIYN